jgi:outer membrane protein assembly factor BamB
MTGGWGTGSSPAIDGERLFVQCDNEEKSFLVALDKHSGDELWKVERTESSNWCTPYIWKNKLRTELVTSGNRVRSYDPATGKLLWEYAKIGGGCKATPVGDAELLYVGTGGGGGGMGGGFSGKGGFGGAPGGNTPNAAGAGRAANSPIIAIRAGASGDVSLQGTETSNQHVAWSIERAGPPMASPLLYRGCLYSLDQRGGIIGCYDAKTGQQHYRERLPDARGFTASPWAADGMVFCLDESGQTFVLKAGPKLEVLATNKLADMFWSSVAIAKGELLLRGIDRLYCIAGQ